ncbi:MAG TPA: sigma-70 family RNA polymerase sigma factor [Polyangia bacterium]|nr:sigma-70 family RNA polymerase sigma factor [Polyangia bacterium]
MTTADKPDSDSPSPTAPSGAPDGGGAAPAESDMALVERARNKDFAAFEELVGRYEDKVFRLAYRFVRNESEAKEILQDTFLSIWRKLDTFKGDAQFSSWVYRVAANAALMRLRSQRRHPEVSTEDLPAGFLDQQQYGQILSPGDNWARRPDDELQSDELRRHIQAAADALPEIYRTVFLVRDVEGLSTEETAEMLGISVPTVKTRLHRARMALRQSIAAYFGKK